MSFFDDILKSVDAYMDAAGFDDEDEVDVAVVDVDGIEYSEVARMEMDGNTYLYMADLDHPENFMIRRLEVEDDGEYLCGLDSDEEFEKLLRLFTEKVLGKDGYADMIAQAAEEMQQEQ